MFLSIGQTFTDTTPALSYRLSFEIISSYVKPFLGEGNKVVFRFKQINCFLIKKNLIIKRSNGITKIEG